VGCHRIAKLHQKRQRQDTNALESAVVIPHNTSICVFSCSDKGCVAMGSDRFRNRDQFAPNLGMGVVIFYSQLLVNRYYVIRIFLILLHYKL
jgi:hypothetical protein